MNKEERRKYIFAQLNSLPNAFQYVEVTNYIKELQQENKELKRNCNIGNENLSFYRNENKELHNKIDKAIKLYKNCKAEDYCTLDLDMYNALIGGDVDE